jgi:hypothetical protein
LAQGTQQIAFWRFHSLSLPSYSLYSSRKINHFGPLTGVESLHPTEMKLRIQLLAACLVKVLSFGEIAKDFLISVSQILLLTVT